MADDARVFEVIEESSVSPALDAEIKALLFEAFPEGRTAFAETRHWHGSAPQYSVICRAGGRIVGNVAIVVRDIRCGKTPVRVAGVQNVGVHPAHRGKNLGGRVLEKAMAEAERRGIIFGLLFCAPRLERYYSSNGWRKVDVPVIMQYQGQRCPIPGRNIAMVQERAAPPFPEGDIDLLGPDW